MCFFFFLFLLCLFFQAEDGIRDLVRSRGLGDVYKRQGLGCSPIKAVRELGSERRETVRSLSAVGGKKVARSWP